MNAQILLLALSYYQLKIGTLVIFYYKSTIKQKTILILIYLILTIIIHKGRQRKRKGG